ncbi:MAG: TolC family protein [Bdellovibrionota bacterium]
MSNSMTRKANSTCQLMAMMVFILSILAAGGAFAQPAAKAKPATGPRLTLEDYLVQVATKHAGYKAATMTSKGAKLTSEEAILLFRPNFFANASASATGKSSPFDDTQPFQYKAYSLGIGQATDFGLTARLTANRNEFALNAGASSGRYDADYTQIELTQSLWRNWAGREIEAQSEAIEYGSLANAYAQSHASKALLLEAEAAYWRLVLSREVVQVQKDALERAQRSSEWASRRARMQLADRAEALQTSTASQARRLELRQAEDEASAAAQAFNASRGLNSNEVPETLAEITPTLSDSMQVPERTAKRDDVKAAELQAKAGAANAQIARERNKPTVEVFANAPLTEPATPTGALATVLPPTSRPSTTVGVRATIPLDFGRTSRVREGYDSQATAATYTFERKAFEEERDWSDLVNKFTQAKQRLKLYEELEKQQREKLLYERDRQGRGRSTLQSVLIYEGDYQVTQLGRIRTLAELLTLNAQMKLYGVSYESR